MHKSRLQVPAVPVLQRSLLTPFPQNLWPNSSDINLPPGTPPITSRISQMIVLFLKFSLNEVLSIPFVVVCLTLAIRNVKKKKKGCALYFVQLRIAKVNAKYRRFFSTCTVRRVWCDYLLCHTDARLETEEVNVMFDSGNLRIHARLRDAGPAYDTWPCVLLRRSVTPQTLLTL